MQQENDQYVHAVLLNIIDGPESSQSRSESQPESFDVNENYSTYSNGCQLYQEADSCAQGRGAATESQGSQAHLLDVSSKKAISLGSFKTMYMCGLLTKNTLR